MAYIHQINNFDIDNDFGNGPVVSVFFNYCSFHCRGCWNKDTWERREELYWDNQKAAKTIITALNGLIKRGMKPNLSLLGGDPIVDENIDATVEIVNLIKTELPNTSICIWTGFDVEDWWRKDTYQKQKRLLKEIEFVVDGRFIHKLKTKNQMFGSINQRVFDAHKLRDWDGANKTTLLDALMYEDNLLGVVDAPGYTTTTRDLMNLYIQPNNRSRTYQLTVLHDLANFQKT